LQIRCSRQLRKSCTGANMYSQAKYFFILEHYFASYSFVVIHEAFNNAYHDNKIPNKIIIHRLVTGFRVTGSFCPWQRFIERQSSLPISSSASAATTGYARKNLILLLVSSFCA
jgi:hypothetical protein